MVKTRLVGEWYRSRAAEPPLPIMNISFPIFPTVEDVLATVLALRGGIEHAY
jgi:hypothetical protein